jgi:hypothetical protein
MFWKKKNKPPVTKNDQNWLDENLSWLREVFTEEHFQSIKTVTLTKDFFNRNFDGSKEDAYFILNRIKELMRIENDNIILEFYNDSPVVLDDGSVLSTPSENIDGSWQAASGTYEQDENDNIILSLEEGQLKDTVSLIATISHELAHEILLGEGWLEKNDEYLTDLTAVFYGFGIFIGNSKFKFSSFNSGIESGWESQAQGYLPLQLIAYATAWLSVGRNENVTYEEFLNPSLKKYFIQSLNFLNSKN